MRRLGRAKMLIILAMLTTVLTGMMPGAAADTPEAASDYLEDRSAATDEYLEPRVGYIEDVGAYAVCQVQPCAQDHGNNPGMPCGRDVCMDIGGCDPGTTCDYARSWVYATYDLAAHGTGSAGDEIRRINNCMAEHGYSHWLEQCAPT